MQLIFNREAAEELRQKYTVLELETISHSELGGLTAWCVVPLEKVYGELSNLNENIKTHESLVKAIADNQPSVALELCEHLTGLFGGELDSFYNEISKRINETGSCILSVQSS